MGKEKSQSFLSQQLGPNDISAINNASTAQDTSMNMTHVELLRKLQPIAAKQTFNYPGDGKASRDIKDDESSVANFKLDNFDLQSQVSHLFAEEELQQYEESIQAQINEIWVGIQQKQDKIQNDFQNELE